jgi:hypothetical protein
MAALLGTDAKAAGAVSIGGVHVGGLIPMDRINQIFDSGALTDLGSNARDQLVAYKNMREAMVGYKTVLSGSARGATSKWSCSIRRSRILQSPTRITRGVP